MQTKDIDLKSLKLDEKNPRKIEKEKLDSLAASIEHFPEMMELRPIVVDEERRVIGGHQRLAACVQLGRNKIPSAWVKVAKGLTEQQKKEFSIKDNVASGEWDLELLEVEFIEDELQEWGLDIEFEEEPDYAALDKESKGRLTGMTGAVRKAIMVDFSLADYDEAFKIIGSAKKNNINVGKFLVDKIKSELS